MSLFSVPLMPAEVFSERSAALEQWLNLHRQAQTKMLIFLGRSNVGKSSLLNALFGRALARVSQTPGKTREIRCYRPVDEKKKLLVIDLPGYGHAKVSKTEQEHWKRMLEYFIDQTADFAFYLCLQDARHPMLENDTQMLDYLRHLEGLCAVVLTKADQLKNQKQRAETMNTLEQRLGHWGLSLEQCYVTSTAAAFGLDELVTGIKHYISTKVL